MARKEELAREKERKMDMEEEEGGCSVELSVDVATGALVAATADNSVVMGTSINTNGVRIRKRPRQLQHESITGFHARVTSEDNAEFELNQEMERKEREKNLAVVYAARADKSGRLMIESCVNNNGDGAAVTEKKASSRALLGCDTPLGLASDLYDAPPSAGLRLTDGSKSNNNNNVVGRNGLFFQPQHQSNNSKLKSSVDHLMLTATGAPSGAGTFLSIQDNVTSVNNLSSGDATQDSENNTANDSFNPDNLIMPPPPSRPSKKNDDQANKSRRLSSHDVVAYQNNKNESNPQTSTSSIQYTNLNHHQLIEYLPKPLLSNINPPATRFPYQNESRLHPYTRSNDCGIMVAHSSSNNNHNGFLTDASETTDLDASPLPLSMERAAHQKARLREQEKFVAMTPLIQPGGMSYGARSGGGGLVEELSEPIMTWGDVASTPLVLGNGIAVDRGHTSDTTNASDWEPTRPPSLSLNMGNVSECAGPAFDVTDENDRETMARCAEKRLGDRAKTYRAAGSSGMVTNDKIQRKDDNILNDSSARTNSRAISKSSSMTPISSTSNILDRTASLTPAARALFEASSIARNAKKTNSRNQSTSSSRIFQPSPITSSLSTHGSSASRTHAGSKDSFGSALRMSYTPSASPSRRRTKDDGRKRKSSSSSSSLCRAAGGATPRCHAFR